MLKSIKIMLPNIVSMKDKINLVLILPRYDVLPLKKDVQMS